MRRAYLAVALFPVLAGCSAVDTYMFRPTNYTHLPQSLEPGETPAVAALSMDASRRLMISQLEPSKFVCSEPPPDAAVSLLAKAALDLSAKPQAGGEAAVKLNDEFAANAVAIAKRTAAVEFWRTTSFSYCLLLMNNKGPEAAAYLQTAKELAPHFGGEQSGGGGSSGGGG